MKTGALTETGLVFRASEKGRACRFGGAGRFRNAVNQLQSLLHAA